MEGIQNITALKDQLIGNDHEQSAAILKRHANVIERWQTLLADSEARKSRLHRMVDEFRQIEELYLRFAKKASSFNSWFENAEEDLTDPAHLPANRFLVLFNAFSIYSSTTWNVLLLSFNNFVLQWEVLYTSFQFNIIKFYETTINDYVHHWYQ